MEVDVTNKVSDVIARFYLDAVSIHGCPRFFKADNVIKHSTVGPVSIGLKMIHADNNLALDSFSFITSPTRQNGMVEKDFYMFN